MFALFWGVFNRCSVETGPKLSLGHWCTVVVWPLFLVTWSQTSCQTDLGAICVD